MQNVAFAVAHGPEALFAIVAAGVLPDHDRSFEDSGAIVEADAASAQRPGLFGFVPLELNLGRVRLKRTSRKPCPSAGESNRSETGP
jgi:hypothetical protein